MAQHVFRDYRCKGGWNMAMIVQFRPD